MADGKQTPLASTYQQVLANMTNILAAVETVNAMETTVEGVSTTVEGIQTTITDLSTTVDDLDTTVAALDKVVNDALINPPEGGDIETDENGNVIVGGLTIPTATVDDPSIPSEYKRDFSVEVKKTTAIGLDSFEDFQGGDYCIVMTFKSTSELLVPYQLAFGNRKMTQKSRHAADDSTWTDWVSVIEIPDYEVHQQVVDSDTEPTDQIEGDLWLAPIT